GFTTRIVITAAEMAGQMAGLQMGLGFAVFFDPQGAGQSPVVAQFMGVLAVLVLLASNSHYLMLTALVESFRIVPLSPAPLAAKGFLTLVSWASQIFQLGLMLSLPVVGALLVTNIGIGILTRAAPQLNVFAVGFPITLGVGFLMLYLSLPLLVPVIEQFSQAGFAVIQRILEGFRS
ncbi:MAG: flagellar biosynthetic protein FliR, partial [Rhodobacter sp.]|nr:flagellar biosynthetic protein FliR [Rhodobacter sp.]